MHTKFTFNKAIGVAACFILVVSAALYMFQNNFNHGSTAWTTVIANENKEITLSDGSRISLRKGSTFKYPVDFNLKARHVKLQGEGYFDVAHQDTRPFTIYTNNALVTDLGTSFLVRSNDSIVDVIVTHGKVNLSNQSAISSGMVLEKGERGLLKGNQVYKKQAKGKNMLAWQNQKLIFAETPLDLVIEELSYYYQRSIQLAPELVQHKIVVTAEFKNQSLQQVLEELELTTGLTVKKAGMSFLFIKKGNE